MDDFFREIATASEIKIIDAVEAAGGNKCAAARALSISESTVRQALKRVKARAAKKGHSPVEDAAGLAPEGFHLKGKSIGRRVVLADGSTAYQWTKTAKDPTDRMNDVLAAIRDVADEIAGKSTPVPPPEYRADDLLCVYPWGDPHVGMFAWPEETGGAAFDLKIAERNLKRSVDLLVALAPHSAMALLANVGDMLHADNLRNVTSASGHSLDVDTRTTKCFQVALRVLIYGVYRMLEKHQTVRVINEIGNHDDLLSFMLSLCMAEHFSNNPRVQIDTSPSPFHWLRFGKVLIGTTHGCGLKLTDLPEIMATDKPEDWGQTEYRYWLTGHVHHDQLKELRGCIAMSFRTIAPRDAWHARKGYRSGRDMKLMVMHKDHGLVQQHVVGISMIEGVA